MNLRYPSFRYDDRLVLKVSPLLWIVLLYALRHVILVGLSFLPKTAGTLGFLRHQIDPLFLLTDVPAFAVVYGYFLRTPQATRFDRRLWHAGRWLLVSSYAMHFVLLLSLQYKAVLTDFLESGIAVMLFAVVDILVLSYLLRSALVRDIFADYPERVEKGSLPSNSNRKTN